MRGPRCVELTGRAPRLTRAQTITVADGHDTHGAVNQHPAGEHASGLRVGVSEDRNRKCRRTMEDSHAFIYDYGGVRGQGFFAVFVRWARSASRLTARRTGMRASTRPSGAGRTSTRFAGPISHAR